MQSKNKANPLLTLVGVGRNPTLGNQLHVLADADGVRCPSTVSRQYPLETVSTISLC